MDLEEGHKSLGVTLKDESERDLLIPALGSALAIRCRWEASARRAGLFELFLVCNKLYF